MAQFARPTSDVLTTGWTTQSGGATNLFATMDETSPADADYARIAHPIGEILKIGLSSVTDPQSSSGHVVRYRIGKSGDGSASLLVSLRQGSTEIASWTHPNLDVLTTYAQTLDASEADAISNYATLQLWFTASDVATGSVLNVDGGYVLNTDGGFIVAQG